MHAGVQVPTLLLGRVLGETLANLPAGSLADNVELKKDILDGAQQIWDAGYSIGDVHLGNIMLWGEGQGNGRRSVFIDFEDAKKDAHASDHELPKLRALLRCSASGEQTTPGAHVAVEERSPFAGAPML